MGLTVVTNLLLDAGGFALLAWIVFWLIAKVVGLLASAAFA